jgi:hypothetical protein
MIRLKDPFLLKQKKKKRNSQKMASGNSKAYKEFEQQRYCYIIKRRKKSAKQLAIS